MNVQQRHWLEKTQVQVVCLLALVAVYFVAWPAFRPWDNGGAVVFVPSGDFGRLVLLAAAVAVLSAGAALLTMQARPEAALLATLVGLSGLSFRSGAMRTVLWQFPGHFQFVYSDMLLETLLLLLILVEAVVIIWLLRAGVRLIRPAWLWQDEAHDPNVRLMDQASAQWHEFAHDLAKGKNGWLILPACLVIEIAIAMLLMICTFRSAERGQIAFALAGSFLLAALATHQLLPIRLALPFWLGPVLTAFLVYAFSPDTFAAGTGPDWRQVELVGHSVPLRAALPLDWLTLGTGGAVAGYWFSRRIHQARRHPQPQVVEE